MHRIILASGSPRRKKLLSQTGWTFEVQPSRIDEDNVSDDPVHIVQSLAHRKASSVSESFSDSLIIGADTIVVHNNEILGKPKDKEQAMEMLCRLSNTEHSVYTGISLLLTDASAQIYKKQTFHEHTKVYFSALSTQEIEAYIKSGSPFDKAGGYGIQDDMGSFFVKKIEGDFYNVVGFPLNKFYAVIKTFLPELKLWDQYDM